MRKLFELVPKNFNLGKKMFILLLTVFILGMIFWGILMSGIFLKSAQNELNAQANLLISTMDSVRKYNADNVSPLLTEQSEETFLVQLIPSFAVREVFEIFTNVYKNDYGKYVYKDAMLNPTNPKDQANIQEIRIIAIPSPKKDHKKYHLSKIFS